MNRFSRVHRANTIYPFIFYFINFQQINTGSASVEFDLLCLCWFWPTGKWLSLRSVFSVQFWPTGKWLSLRSVFSVQFWPTGKWLSLRSVFSVQFWPTGKWLSLRSVFSVQSWRASVHGVIGYREILHYVGRMVSMNQKSLCLVICVAEEMVSRTVVANN